MTQKRCRGTQGSAEKRSWQSLLGVGIGSHIPKNDVPGDVSDAGRALLVFTEHCRSCADDHPDFPDIDVLWRWIRHNAGFCGRLFWV